jgi:3-deoxy-D-manno-octulosonate 8-phosphate phosphatase KdsC-like HAD superfamily phosphatase
LPHIVAAVDYICQKKGGEGAVREIIEMILEAQSSKLEVPSSEKRS